MRETESGTRRGEPGGGRRLFTRVPFQGRGWLVEPRGGRRRVEVVDLCLQGALVALPRGWAPRPGEELVLELELAPGEPPLAMETVVAHLQEARGQDAGRAGLRCLRLDLEAMTRLRRLVELNLGDAEALDRELEALARGPGG